jgi:iduronate 2-sulfatase
MSRGKAMGYSARTDRYRYTEWVAKKGGHVVARELYDHETDANESVNVVEQNRAVSERLARLLRKHRGGEQLKTPKKDGELPTSRR